MKKHHLFRLIFGLSLLLLANTTFAQKLKPEDIPDKIIEALDFEYPGVKVQSWVLEKEQFVANFKEEGLTTKAYFANDGTWVKTLNFIPKKELPTAIVDYVTTNYPAYVIAVSALQQKPDTRTHYYIEAKIDGFGNLPSILTFTDNGKLMERVDPEGFSMEHKQVVQQTAQKPAKVKNDAEKETEKAEKPEKAAKPEKVKEAKEPKAVAEKPAKPEKQEKADKKKGKKDEVKAGENPPLNPTSIPAAVAKTLTKKAQRPEDLKWYRVDNLYVAKCTTKLKYHEIYIDDKAVWQKTLMDLPEESVTGNMLKHLKAFYKGYRFAKATKEFRADKQDKVYVQIYEKRNWKAKLITTIIFDKTGKLLKTIDADDFTANTETTEEDTDLDKYYQDFDKRAGETTGAIRPKDLPTDVQTYISINYPSYEIEAAALVKDEDFGEIYRTDIKAQSAGNETVTLFFNKDGKFLKKNSSASKSEHSANGDIPAEVLNVFKTKYPRVVEPEWQVLDNQHYQVDFNGTKGKTMCLFDAAGQILETHNALNVANVTQNISDYVKKEYKGGKIMEYYRVVKADKKTYFKVVVQEKKTKELVSLLFTNAGKFIEIL